MIEIALKVILVGVKEMKEKQLIMQDNLEKMHKNRYRQLT
jgi:hypothetical protein